MFVTFVGFNTILPYFATFVGFKTTTPYVCGIRRFNTIIPHVCDIRRFQQYYTIRLWHASVFHSIIPYVCGIRRLQHYYTTCLWHSSVSITFYHMFVAFVGFNTIILYPVFVAFVGFNNTNTPYVCGLRRFPYYCTTRFPTQSCRIPPANTLLLLCCFFCSSGLVICQRTGIHKSLTL